MGLAVLALVVVGGVVAAVVLPGDDTDAADPTRTTEPTQPTQPTAEVTPAVDLCNAGDSFEEEPSPDDDLVHGGGSSFAVPAVPAVPAGYRADEDASFGYQLATDIEVVASPLAGGTTSSTYAVAAPTECAGVIETLTTG